ncbi:MAG: ABC transporter permease [Actinomycetia bacterium]|nr:ABC transporter permease [Actinomycetes bacterium]
MTFFRGMILRFVSTSVLSTMLVFVAIELSIPGGYQAVLLPNGVNRESPRDMAIVDQFYLDDHVLVRWFHWVVDAFHGDLGRSNKGGAEVVEIIAHRLPITLELAAAGLILALVVGIPLGVFAAVHQRRWSGQLVSVPLGLAQSIPAFMSATLLIWVFALELGWVRASGWTRISSSLSGNLGGLVLPAVALALAEVGVIARVVRSDMLGVLREDFVVAARGKGLSSSYVLFRHALRPASLGLLAVLSVSISSMIAGTFVVEIVFGIGALGRELIDASQDRDLYVLLGLTMYIVGFYIVVTAIIDLVMYWADPRIRRG